LIISLSAINYGISLKEITSVPIAELVKHYSIPIDKFAAQSILIGILPFGAIFGVLVTKALITRYRRLAGIYIFTFVNIGAIVLVNVTTFGTLIAGRFLEGVCIGYYTNIAPIYLKEIAPRELRRLLGLFFSFGKIVGVLISAILELIFDAAPFSISWRILLSLTAVFSTIQAILIFFFGSDTPTEMIEKGKDP
jgi:MFS family permease